MVPTQSFPICIDSIQRDGNCMVFTILPTSGLLMTELMELNQGKK